MIHDNKTKDEIEKELISLQKKYDSLKASLDNQLLVPSRNGLTFCQNEKKYCIIAEHTSDTIAVFDMDLNITYISPSVKETHGYEQSEALLLKLNQILTPDSLQTVYRVLERTLPLLSKENGTTPKFKPLELEQYKKNGTKIWTEVSYSFLKDQNNQPKGIVAISRDISEFKQAEAKLRDSEARFKTLSSVTSEGLMIHENGIILDANLAFAKLLGYSTPDELLGKNGFEIVRLTSDSTPSLNGHLRPLADGIYDVGIINIHGQVIPTEIRGIDITYNERKARLIFFRDITKRKQEENKLRASVSLLDASLESTADGILIVDREGNNSKWNQKFLHMWNFTEETLSTQNDAYLINSILQQLSDPDQFLEKIKYLYKNPEESSFDQIHFLDGRIFERYSQAQRIGDEIVGRVWSFRDISSRIYNEEKISVLAHAIRSISECISITDMEDKTLFVNQAFLKTYRYNENEILGKSIRMIRSPKNPKSITEKILPETIKGGWHGELINVRKDGSEFPVFLSTSIIRDDDGNPIALIGVANDITERKQVELEIIKAKEKAEESDRLKLAFLANMSHEIRTPMNGILGFAELLKTPGLKGKHQKEYIDIIEKSGNRMLNILNDIIDISKIEAGQIDVCYSETDVNEMIESIYTFFKPEAEEKGLKLFYKNNLPLKKALINTDKEKLYAIISNLVKNSIKYSKEGWIDFGYTYKNHSDSPDPPHIEFFVKDTGVGIPKNRQEAIFERFIQADIHDNKALHGAGLGLSISKAYVQLLNGKIWVESEEGKGSAFYFTLPVDSEKGADNDMHDENDAFDDLNPLKNIKVLVVEDDEMSSRFITLVLSKLNAVLLYAKTGVEAVDQCRSNPDIDLVLMDINMPVMNGFDATAAIREFNKEVIIIAQTAFAFRDDKDRSLQAGCNDYISKPIKINELMKLIQSYFIKIPR